MKSLSFVLFTVFWVSGAGADPSSVIFKDNFESYKPGLFPNGGGWVLRFDGFGPEFQEVVTGKEAQTVGQVLKLEGRCNWASELTHRLPRVSERMRLEAKVRLEKLEEKCLPYQDAIVTFENNANYAQTYYGIHFASTGKVGELPFEYDQWYAVRVDIDTKKRLYSSWLDGKPVQKDMAFTKELPDTITLTSHNSRHTVTYYDDVVVTELP